MTRNQNSPKENGITTYVNIKYNVLHKKKKRSSQNSKNANLKWKVSKQKLNNSENNQKKKLKIIKKNSNNTKRLKFKLKQF